MSAFLEGLEKERNVDFIFDEALMKDLRINGIFKSRYLEEYLNELLKSSGHTLVKARENVYVIIPEELRWDYGKNSQNYLKQ